MPTSPLRPALLEAMRAKTGAGIRLPSSLSISGTTSDLLLDLSALNVGVNMQSDAGAFDAWALALWALAGVDTISVKWTAPTDPKQCRHYQRFLFRLRTMLRLFPKRLLLAQGMSVQDDAKPFDSINICDEDRGKRKRPVDGEAALEWDLARADTTPGRALRTSDNLLDVIPQIPVGIFHERVSESSAVFTGKKSAIDLVGWDDKGALHLYELKDSGNAKVGIVSELLFYVSIILEMRAGRIKPKDRKGKAPADPVYAAIGACNRITGTFLASDFHPLLVPNLQAFENAGAQLPIITLLNEAFRMCPATVPVTFRARRL